VSQLSSNNKVDESRDSLGKCCSAECHAGGELQSFDEASCSSQFHFHSTLRCRAVPLCCQSASDDYVSAFDHNFSAWRNFLASASISARASRAVLLCLFCFEGSLTCCVAHSYFPRYPLPDVTRFRFISQRRL
jgi:hypothetical protein